MKDRERLHKKIAQIIYIHRTRIPFDLSIDELAEKILEELGL